MNRYYAEKLSAARLQRCYEVASPRVVQYLEAELDHILERIAPQARVLELGCGYGRVVKVLLTKAKQVIGIDNSFASLQLALDFVAVPWPSCAFLQMDALQLGFASHSFDMVLCIQNGISAFKVDPFSLLQEMLRVARPGALLLLSSYADHFWNHRLEWFQRQSDEGLLGEIDHERTGNGIIVCKDGFKATIYRPDDFQALAHRAGVATTVTVVDDSSVFCEITVPVVSGERSP